MVVMQDVDCRTPIHAPSLLAFFAARAVPGVEEVDGTLYRRSVALAHGPGVLALELGEAPRWALERGDPRDAARGGAARGDAARRGRRPGGRRRRARRRPAPARARARRARPRVPGCVDPAEIAVRAVLGQQVSVAAARTQAGRLTERLGERLPGARRRRHPPVPGPARARRARPRGAADAARPRPLARRDGRRARGRPGPARPRRLPRAHAGSARGRADYVAMRCGDRDVLLETDLGVRRGFARIADPAQLIRRAEAWRPWRSYAVQHLWSLA